MPVADVLAERASDRSLSGTTCADRGMVGRSPQRGRVRRSPQRFGNRVGAPPLSAQMGFHPYLEWATARGEVEDEVDCTGDVFGLQQQVRGGGADW